MVLPGILAQKSLLWHSMSSSTRQVVYGLLPACLRDALPTASDTTPPFVVVRFERAGLLICNFEIRVAPLLVVMSGMFIGA